MNSQREALDDLLSHLVFLSTDGMADPKHWIEYRKGGKTIPAGTAIANLISQQAREAVQDELMRVAVLLDEPDDKPLIRHLRNRLAGLERSSDE